jgi:hypothetical protein
MKIRNVLERGWGVRDAAREARRAVTDAASFLVAAKSVRVLVI